MNTVFLHEGESRESLFRNKRFMLDEMFQQNKYLEYENLCDFGRFMAWSIVGIDYEKIIEACNEKQKKYMDLIILKICQILKCFAKTSYFRQFLNVSIESVRKKVTSLHTRKQQITSFFFGVLCLLWTLYSDLGKTCNRIIVPGRCESTCFRIDCIMIILERILVLKWRKRLIK